MGAFPMGVLPSGARADVGLVWPVVRHGAPPRSDSNDPSNFGRAHICLGGW